MSENTPKRRSIFADPEPAVQTATQTQSQVLTGEVLNVQQDQLPATQNTTTNAVAARTVTANLVSEQQISSLGNAGGATISGITHRLLANQRANDTEGLSSKLNDLIAQAKQLAPENTQQGGITGLFKKILGKKEQFFAQFDTVNNRIVILCNELNGERKTQETRKKDIEDLIVANQNYGQAMNNDFQNGQVYLEQLGAEVERLDNPQTTEEAQALSEVKARYDLLEKKLTDLQALRLMSVNMHDKLMDMKNNAVSLMSTFDDIIGKVVPAYTLVFSQYIISMDQERAGKLQHSTMDAFNEALVKGSNLALKNKEESAHLRNRQLVSIETLKLDHENMLKGIESVKRIDEEARTKRISYVQDIRDMEKKLIEVHQSK